MLTRTGHSLALLVGLLGAAGLSPLAGQAPGATRLTPNLYSNIERPLRYTPEGEDFVIVNGGEFFNRPLYGGNTAFRVDAGDQPEFVLYLPGRGGNLRFGLRTAAGTKWLHAAAHVESRYRPGGMLYAVRDPLLGPDGVLHLAAYALSQTEGLIVRAEATGVPAGVELVWAYGGVNGQRGKRDGDIGTESVPISEWFQLRPEFCAGNRIGIAGNTFTLQAQLPKDQTATLRGIMPAGSTLTLADATHWSDAAKLFPVGSALGPTSFPQIIAGRVPLTAHTPRYFAIQRIDATAAAPELDTYREVTAARPGTEAATARVTLAPAYEADQLPAVFAETEAHFAALRGQLLVVTPDPYINAAVGALNVAADAVWDEPQGAVMHGAIAWRSRLLGWRGPYAMDALGWTDRARRHLAYWSTRQNTDPVPEKLPPPDADANLARSEAALHSNGDLSNSHYDMNLVYIDALFRHLLWTGDVAFAKQVWPVIERHLAWERRLFRREFAVNGEKLPLYEAYAAIWASDDLQYSGGGTAHASAYNYWHNRMAARVAKLLGHDPAPYQREADLIARGMRELLWTGTHFAESKDWLGRQLVHPSAALWTFYHAMDSGWAGSGVASDFVLHNQPKLPIRGPGVPTDRNYAMFSSTDWLPYSWSINNVVMGENVHTALGFWQDGRSEEAFTLLKSSLLASMFMGISPGNVGSMNYLDVYRRESQRDFADGNGVTARAIVEGLFGLRPDALARSIEITPGFPDAWEHAQLVHPSVRFTFLRHGSTDTYEIAADASKFSTYLLKIRARGETCRVTVESRDLPRPFRFTPSEMSPVMSFGGQLRSPVKTTIEWFGDPIPSPAAQSPGLPVCGMVLAPGCPPTNGLMDPLALAPSFNDRVTAIFQKGKYLSPRSPFVSLALPAQGIGAWAGHVNAMADIDDTGLRRVAAEHGGRLRLPNGVAFATPGPGDAPNILFVSQWDNYPREATVALTGKAQALHLLMAGSTNYMQSRLDNGEVVVTYIDGTTSRLALRNPETWWPIEQDYFIDDYQFRVEGPLPTRVDLKTGLVRVLDSTTFKGKGREIPGGAATVLGLSLDPEKELQSLTIRALTNDVVIGLMAATLVR
jgi:hypothetical protein